MAMGLWSKMVRSRSYKEPFVESTPVLEIRDISKTYDIISDPLAARGRRAVLDGVSLTLRSGEIYGFVGLNGAGKTTTIRIALGLTRPDRGQVRFLGQDSAPENLRRLGFAPEKPSFYEFLNALETLRFSARLLGTSMGDARVRQVLEDLELWNDREKMVRDYSKGMQQRLALACAMLHDPDVYILDEPGSGLDPLGRRRVKELLRALRARGKTVFFSTHILADVRELCDRVGVIHGGHMLFEGPLESLNPNGGDLEEAFVSLVSGHDLPGGDRASSRQFCDTEGTRCDTP